MPHEGKVQPKKLSAIYTHRKINGEAGEERKAISIINCPFGMTVFCQGWGLILDGLSSEKS